MSELEIRDRPWWFWTRALVIAFLGCAIVMSLAETDRSTSISPTSIVSK